MSESVSVEHRLDVKDGCSFTSESALKQPSFIKPLGCISPCLYKSKAVQQMYHPLHLTVFKLQNIAYGAVD